MGKLLDNGTCMRLQTDNREMQQIACWQSKLSLTSETLSHSLHAFLTSAVVFRASAQFVTPTQYYTSKTQSDGLYTRGSLHDTLTDVPGTPYHVL